MKAQNLHLDELYHAEVLQFTFKVKWHMILQLRNILYNIPNSLYV